MARLVDLLTVCSVAPTLRCIAQKDILDKVLPCRRTCFVPVALSAENSVMLYEFCFGIRSTVVGNSDFHIVRSKYHVPLSRKSASGSAHRGEIACTCWRKFVSMDLIVSELNMDDVFFSSQNIPLGVSLVPTPKHIQIVVGEGMDFALLGYTPKSTKSEACPRS